MTPLEWAQFVALVLAALIFLVKAWQGWFYVNMSLSGTTERLNRGDGQDDLVVKMTLTRGSTGTLTLHETAVCFSWPGASPRYEKLVGTARLAIEKDKDNETGRLKYKIRRPWMPEGSPYKMPPMESSIWSCCVQVPTGQVCTIEVAVIGQRKLSWVRGEWRASLVSLPVDEVTRHISPEG